MNSGCYGEDISKIFLSLDAINLNGEIETYNKEQINFFYRGNDLNKKLIIIGATFKGELMDKKNFNKKRYPN